MTFIANLLKFLFFIVFIPILVTIFNVFLSALSDLPKSHANWFLFGMGSFLVLHLFILEMRACYDFGHKLVSDLLKFLGGFASPLALIVPTYATIVLLFYLISNKFLDVSELDKYFLFLAGFMLLLHLVFSAKFIREDVKQGGVVSYYFYMSLVFVINLLIVAIFFSGIYKDYSFTKFMETVFDESAHIYVTIYQRLLKFQS